MGLLTGKFPYKGLRYPKFTEKPPFQTWDQIQRRIKAGGLSDAEKRTLWDCLYLQSAETADLLAHVKARAAQPWVYPLFCFAAYTGTRRAEMLRVLVADVDFDGKTVLIREKKRAKGKTTTRRIPLTSLLARVLKDWLAVYPGGQYLFCQSPTVVRSKTKRMASTPITHDEAHDHFKRVVRGSKWDVLRGYHVLRHSFISACASKGIDQRLIDEWTGHATDERRKLPASLPLDPAGGDPVSLRAIDPNSGSTTAGAPEAPRASRGVDQRMLQEWCGHMSPEMSRRYAHLWPSSQQEAIKSVFG